MSAEQMIGLDDNLPICQLTLSVMRILQDIRYDPVGVKENTESLQKVCDILEQALEYAHRAEGHTGKG